MAPDMSEVGPMLGDTLNGWASVLTGGNVLGGGSWTGLMMVSASSSFRSTSRRIGKLIVSMCLAK